MSTGYFPLQKAITKDLPRQHFLGMQRQLAGDIAQKAGYGANSDTSSPIFTTGALGSVIPLFVRKFPLWEMLRKIPANGISHTWAQQVNFTQTFDPNTIAETAFVNDDANAYVRQTTNIAIFAERRSASLKAALAGRAQGTDLFDLELEGGLITLARDVQNEILRYQDTIGDGLHTAAATKYTNPDGAYDAYGFNGLRFIANNQTPPENSIAVNVATPGWTDHRVLFGVRSVIDAMFDKGADATQMVIVCSSYAAEQLLQDEIAFVRYVPQGNSVEVLPSFTVKTVSTNQGAIPIMVIPAMGSGYNTYSQTIGGNAHNVEDMFILDTDKTVLPYLGNPEPSILRIPSGVNGQLVEMAIPYMMCGLACLAPSIGLGRVQLLKS